MISRVGSYLSQSVYSVATPFHPFGGAVDIIVVQQQDGSFRSTPWYVRFGKFQGVLKGAEKIVKIEVNGVEADFHMYLDNSGEAYFIKEVAPEKDTNVNDSLESKQDDYEDNSIKNNNVEVHFHDNGESTESDSEKRFYELQDEQSSSLDELYDDNLESESQNSEVVLFSIDGQILSAPITSMEENTDNVQLSTPQFHLGPIEGPEFEGDLDLSSESTWAHYLSDFNRPKDKNLEREVSIKSVVVEDVKKDDVFKSCLALNDLGKQEDGGEVEVDVEGNVGVFKISESSTLEVETEGIEVNLLEKEEKVSDVAIVSNQDLQGLVRVERSETKGIEVISLDTEQKLSDLEPEAVERPEIEGTEVISLDAEQKVSDLKPEGVERSETEGTEVISPDTEQKVSDVEDGLNGAETGETQPYFDDNERFDGPRRSRIELSLCGNLLRPGMGISTAAETFNAHRIPSEEFQISATSIIKNDSLIVKIDDKYFTWDKVAHIVLGMAAYGLQMPIDPNDSIPVEDSGLPSTPSRRWRLWPIPFRRVKTLDHNTSNLSGEDVFLDSESVFDSPQAVETTPTSSTSPQKQFVRTQTPTTEQISSLNLKEGQNMVSFIFSTRVLGVQKVDAHIYLWKWNARIVISDVDGTITKSDVLGQFMPLVGKDWTQSGVARLFSAIKENGYQLLFLSARAIVQAYLTRSFLLNLKQDGKALPNGPVVISPDGLFPSLFREVIRRAPHEFKIACLEDIKALFPSDYNPFYAGFGNRDTDELSYRKIGIPKGKIFIINPKGEVAISHRMDMKGKSYTSLHTLVNDMFPPTSMIEQEDFNSWNYWRVPLPDVE
ncbi:hypothetical protein L2E82_28414 [Cichorium intybus]|uniref:Uncharacterized protein n=1 Tax=Cichorium intybus TaxID=13427 RepID=A0ACB9CVP0_CICIN|nr:hypothetical protein L2E82_28414 [Cichorium intybus]